MRRFYRAERRSVPGGVPSSIRTIRGEHPGDHGVRADLSQDTHRRDDVRRGVLTVLPAAPPRQPQFGVHTPLPVDDEDDFPRGRVHIDHDLVDQRAYDAFLQASIGVRMLPHRLQVGGQLGKLLRPGCRRGGLPIPLRLDLLLHLADAP
jgi:hypothetical protein